MATGVTVIGFKKRSNHVIVGEVIGVANQRELKCSGEDGMSNHVSRNSLAKYCRDNNFVKEGMRPNKVATIKHNSGALPPLNFLLFI